MHAGVHALQDPGDLLSPPRPPTHARPAKILESLRVEPWESLGPSLLPTSLCNIGSAEHARERGPIWDARPVIAAFLLYLHLCQG